MKGSIDGWTEIVTPWATNGAKTRNHAFSYNLDSDDDFLMNAKVKGAKSRPVSAGTAGYIMQYVVKKIKSLSTINVMKI